MLTYPFVVNNVTYNESDFAGLGYVTKLGEAFWNLVNQVLLGYGSTSATSVNLNTVASPATMTIGAGLAWKVGDFILAVDSAAPTTNALGGAITAYNFTTGVVTFDIDVIIGTATIAAWNIVPGAQLPFTAHGFIPVESGGSGFAYTGNTIFAGDVPPDSVSSAMPLAINSPRSGMEEIFVDFTYDFVQLEANATNIPPFVYGNILITLESALADADDNTYYGGIKITPNGFVNSGYLSYNNSGFFHAGRGKTVYETGIVNLYSNGYYRTRFGLKAQNSGATNIFSYGGIGFEAFNPSAGMGDTYSSGLIVCVCGASGVVTRVLTNVLPTTGIQRFRIEVSHLGDNVDYYINDTLVASIATNIPISDYKNLLHPYYEVPADTAGFAANNKNYLLIDTLYLNKKLLR